MRRSLLSIMFLFFLAGCDSQVRESELVGKWRSNKPLILASLEASKELTDEHRSIIKNDPSFGNLIYEFEIKRSRIMVVDSGKGYDFVDRFREYNLLEENGDHFKINAYDILFEKYTDQIFFREGNCFYEYYEERDFKEYYCKVSD